MPGKDKIPAAVDGAGELCIRCGHCVAVCPYGALSTDTIAPGACGSLPAGWQLSAAQVESLLKGRRSIRSFTPEDVSRERLEALIAIAAYAPSGVNRQPLRWSVIEGREKVAALGRLVIAWMSGLIQQKTPIASALRMGELIKAHEKGLDHICRNAPHLVYTYALKEDMLAASAATIALTYLDLAAVSMGLGTCWAGYAHMALNSSDECRKLAGMNERCDCFGAMLVGYPVFSYCRIPPRAKPRIHFR